jgi:hypothetical protein
MSNAAPSGSRLVALKFIIARTVEGITVIIARTVQGMNQSLVLVKVVTGLEFAWGRHLD